MSLFESASLIVTPNGVKEDKLYSIKPTDGSGDLVVTRATTATRVNSAGLIESSAVNVPRLDYTGSTCPSILVEPQRTNLFLRSEEFDNASWAKPNITVTANNTIAPDGNLTADLITATATNGYLYPANTSIFSSAGGTSRAYSVFLKAGTATSVRLIIATASVSQNFSSTFNLSLGTATADTANTTVFIENYGNGWYRCTISATIASATYSELQLGRIANGLNFYAWGAQLEAGSNATSYIPTTSATVTRNADVISKTGISSLIGQTEGTLFADVNFDYISSSASNLMSINNNVNTQAISLNRESNNRLQFFIFNSGVQANIITTNKTNGRFKVIATYKANEFKLFVNGVLIGTDTSGTLPSLSTFNLGNIVGGVIQKNNINLAALWKTALTDQECINLTTI